MQFLQEDNYILQQFKKNFLQNLGAKIVIYGVGARTETLLNNLKFCELNNIVGLMDEQNTGKTMFGLRVLSYEEVSSLENVVIVVIARKSVENIIYRRIEKFVTDNGISVYSVNGSEIKSDTLDMTPKKCFMLKKNDLLAKIDDADMVSFDIFDTLICRRVLRPTDVFGLVDTSNINISFNFPEERIKAETEVYIDNYDIDDIYNQMQKNTGISDYIRETLKKEEYEAEKKVLYVRDEMLKILQYALEKDKKVYLISDMYWNKRYLADLLDLKGIKGYIELVVSTDYKTSKSEKLFEKVRDQFNLDTSKWVHIGDNAYSDIKSADALGINTYKIYSTIEMLENSVYSKLLGENIDIQENVIISRYAAIAYNNPFGNYESNGKLNLEGDESVVKLLIVPLIYKYICWLIKMVKQHCEELVVFPSRDGFLLRKIYEGMRKFDKNIPTSVYFYTSRRAAMTAAVKCEEDVLKELSVPDERNICEVIKARFDNNISGIQSINDIDDVFMECLLKQAAREHEGLIKYAKNMEIDKYSKIGFVDLVAAGTVQKFLQDALPVTFKGYYFMKRKAFDDGYEKISYDSLFPISDDYSAELNIYKYYYFLENIVTSPEPSFMKNDINGELVFFNESRSVEQIDCINNLFRIIETECLSIQEILGDKIETSDSIKIYDDIFGFLGKDYINISDSMILRFVNVDEFMGKKVTEVNR